MKIGADIHDVIFVPIPSHCFMLRKCRLPGKVYVICHEVHCFQSCLVTLQMYCGSYKRFSSQIIDQCRATVHCLGHCNGNCKIRRTACGKMAWYHTQNTQPMLQYSGHPEYCVCCVWHVKPKIIQIWVTSCCGICSVNIFYSCQFSTTP